MVSTVPSQHLSRVAALSCIPQELLSDLELLTAASEYLWSVCRKLLKALVTSERRSDEPIS